MENKEFTIAKFQTCTTGILSELELFYRSEMMEIQNFDYNKFNKLLIKNDLEEYSQVLYQYLYNILELNQLNWSSHSDHFIYKRENDEYFSDLVKAMYFLLAHGNQPTLSIRLTKSVDSFSINNDRLIYDLENFFKSKCQNYFKGQQMTLEIIANEIRQIDNELKKKTGAPTKNHNITILAQALEDLLKIEKYLLTKDADDIDRIKLKSNNYRFIYECLDFWGFIPEKEANSSTPEKYMLTTINQGKQLLSKDYQAQRLKRILQLKEKLSTT